MFFLNNFNQHIYQWDVPVLFTVKDFYQSNLQLIHMIWKNKLEMDVNLQAQYLYLKYCQKLNI